MSQATATARTESTSPGGRPSDAERLHRQSAEAQETWRQGWGLPGAGAGEGAAIAVNGWATFMAVQQRNLAACMLANQRLVEAAQAALQHELRFLEESMQDGIARSRAIMSETDPARRVEQRLELQRRCLEQMLGNAQHVYDLLAKPQLDALEILSRRALASMEEMGGAPTAGA